jgi:hypothetical protein
MGEQDSANNTGDTDSIGSVKPSSTESNGTGAEVPSVAPEKDPLKGIDFYCYEAVGGVAQYYVCQRSGNDLGILPGPEEKSLDAVTDFWKDVCRVAIAPGTRETSRRQTGGLLRYRTSHEVVAQAESIVKSLENGPKGGWTMSECLSSRFCGIITLGLMYQCRDLQ